MKIRPAVPSDVSGILRLMAPHVAEEILLPRTEEEVRGRLSEFVVLDDGGIAGVAALHHYGAGLAEVRSLAVAPSHAGNGFGRDLVGTLVEEARVEGLERIIALTRSPGFFERLGFERTSLEALPQKVARDCAACPRRERCDEVAVLLDLR